MTSPPVLGRSLQSKIRWVQVIRLFGLQPAVLTRTLSSFASNSRPTAVTRSSPNWPNSDEGRSYSKTARLVLIEQDAQRRIERGCHPVLSHSTGSERIADLVQHGHARKAGGAQQPAVTPGTEDRKLRTALQRLVRPYDVAPPECLGYDGIERRHQRFERRLDGFERLRSFDPNVFDLNSSLGNDRVGHNSSH
jgi:hypothetical protein